MNKVPLKNIQNESIDDIFLGLALGVGVAVIIGIIINYNGANLADSIRLIASLSTVMALLIGLSIYKRNSAWRHEDKNIDDSKFYLDKSIEAYNYFYDLLKDQNNERFTWIMAARVLGDAEKLSFQVSHESHQSFLNFKKFEIRNNLFKVLTVVNPETEEPSPLPVQFFFGVKDWRTMTVDEAAKASTGKIVARAVARYGIPEFTKNSYLSIKSVIPIMNFLDFPDDYDDPIQKYKSEDAGKWSGLFHYKVGGKHYIDYMEEHTLTDGKIITKEKQDA